MDELEEVSKKMDDLLTEHVEDAVDCMDSATAKMLYKLLISDLKKINNTIKDDLCL